MNSTTISTATAAGAASLSVVVIAQWLLSYAHISMPADVATAVSTLLTWGVHCIAARQKKAVVTPIMETAK